MPCDEISKRNLPSLSKKLKHHIEKFSHPTQQTFFRETPPKSIFWVRTPPNGFVGDNSPLTRLSPTNTKGHSS